MGRKKSISLNTKTPSRSHNPRVSAAWSDPERITRRSQVSTARSALQTDQEMAARMASISTTDIWSANPATSTPSFSSHKKRASLVLRMLMKMMDS